MFVPSVDPDEVLVDVMRIIADYHKLREKNDELNEKLVVQESYINELRRKLKEAGIDA